MDDFKEIISYKRYWLVEGLGTFKYGADLNHYLTEKSGQSHYKHRIYYDIHVQVDKKPKPILGSEILRLYASKFSIQNIDKGINVYYNQEEYFLEADHFYLENIALPDHVQPEGEESHGDFVDAPVLFIVHEIKEREICKKDIRTGNVEEREDGIYEECTTGEFILGSQICATDWRLKIVDLPPPTTECKKDDQTGEREHRDNCYRLEFYSGQLLEDGQTCETYWGEWICECVQDDPTGNEREYNGWIWKEYFNDNCTTYWKEQKGTSNPQGCLGIFKLLFAVAWAALMIYLAVNNRSFLPILLGIGIPLLLFGLVQAIGWLGRMSRFFGLFLKWSLNLLLLIVLLSVFDGLFQLYENGQNWNSEANNTRTTRDVIEVEEVNPNDNSNANTIDENNEFQKPYKLIHLKWEDQNRRKYNGSFKLLIEDLSRSSYNLRSLEDQNYNSFTEIYSSVYNLDKGYLKGLYNMLDSIKDKNQQNKIEFAATLVTMVQSIEYVLVLDKSCSDPYNRRNPIIRELLDGGVKCFGPAPFGLKTPSEFLASTEGDCDTRTLLLYTIFKHYKYDVAIINSEYYGHSMLGLNVEGARGMYKNYNGKKYYFWETTQFGPKLGELQREIGNINYWKITLN